MNRETVDEEKGTLWKWFAPPVWPYVESLIDNLGEFRFLLGSEQSECPLTIDPQTVVPLLGRYDQMMHSQYVGGYFSRYWDFKPPIQNLIQSKPTDELVGRGSLSGQGIIMTPVDK